MSTWLGHWAWRLTSPNSKNSKSEGILNKSKTTTSKERALLVQIDETKNAKNDIENIQSSLDEINEALTADPTKELISFLKEDI